MKGLGNRIKELRGEMSRELFAKKIGISHRSLVNYEQEERIPKADAIALMCSKLGVSADWLLFGYDSKERETALRKHIYDVKMKYSEAADRNELFRNEFIKRVQLVTEISSLLLKGANSREVGEIELFLEKMTKYPDFIFRINKPEDDPDLVSVESPFTLTSLIGE